jgi:hypothetical protein
VGGPKQHPFNFHVPDRLVYGGLRMERAQHNQLRLRHSVLEGQWVTLLGERGGLQGAEHPGDKKRSHTVHKFALLSGGVDSFVSGPLTPSSPFGTGDAGIRSLPAGW